MRRVYLNFRTAVTIDGQLVHDTNVIRRHYLTVGVAGASASRSPLTCMHQSYCNYARRGGSVWTSLQGTGWALHADLAGMQLTVDHTTVQYPSQQHRRCCGVQRGRQCQHTATSAVATCCASSQAVQASAPPQVDACYEQVWGTCEVRPASAQPATVAPVLTRSCVPGVCLCQRLERRH